MGFLTKALSKIGGAIAKPLGWAGGIASAVAPWAGAAYSLWGDRKARKAEKAFNERNSLSGRVAEAQAAGIHPLAALGYNAGGSVTGQSDAGSAIADGVNAVQRGGLQKAQIRAANASSARDIAEAGLLNSQAKRIQQTANSQPHNPVNSVLPPQAMIDVLKDGKKLSIPNPELMEDEVSGNIWALEQFWNRYRQRSKAASAAERRRIVNVLKYGHPAKRKPYYPPNGSGTIRR